MDMQLQTREFWPKVLMEKNWESKTEGCHCVLATIFSENQNMFLRALQKFVSEFSRFIGRFLMGLV